MAHKILIVDDEELIRWSLSEGLGAAGYKAVLADDAASAVAVFEAEAPDVVLTDLRLGGSSGIDVIREVRSRRPDIPVILMTAFADVPSAVEALRQGAADYISKPIQLEGLKITLKRVLETESLRTRLREAHRRRKTRYSFDTLVAQSRSMREIVATCRKLAAFPQGTVLILGESGCGKDRLARTIHYESPRAEQPWMEISCTSIPDNLLESELFGHERGAFTGAMQRKKGLFEMAANGTVFLNEIGHMPLALQAKMLRVLEDKTFRRVGGVEDISVDVRIICATNENLEKAVAEGRFRQDLFYRINVLTLNILPLRERPEDILPLVGSLFERLSSDLGRPAPTLSEETKKALVAHPWQGNVRELRNILERMMILGETEFCPSKSLRAPGAAAPSAGARPSDAAASPVSLPEGGVSLEEVERSFVAQALERSGGSQQKAAAMLGLSRDALRRRIEKFGLKAVSAAALLCWTAAFSAAGLFGGKEEKKPEVDPFLAAHGAEAAPMRAEAVVHAPVRDGACSKCHASPQDPKKLVFEPKKLCLSCHADRAKDLKKTSIHMPFKEQDCGTCHLPHSSKQKALLTAPPVELCSQCHTLADAPLPEKHGGITAFSGDCTACHAAHGSKNAKLLLESPRHMPFETGTCDSCHAKPSAEGKAVLQDPLSGACFGCHADLQDAAKKKTVHVPFAAGDCVSCHEPHLVRRPAMLKEAAQTICRTCHEKIPDTNHPSSGHPSFRPGVADPNRKEKPFDCASCHNPHAADQARLMRSDFGELCLSCHKK